VDWHNSIGLNIRQQFWIYLSLPFVSAMIIGHVARWWRSA